MVLIYFGLKFLTDISTTVGEGIRLSWVVNIYGSIQAGGYVTMKVG